MIIYSVLMFVSAIVFLSFGIAIYKGNTKLIHDYHQTKVKESEKKDYGKAFSKGIFLISISLALSGSVALLGDSVHIIGFATSILFLGMIISFVILLKVQSKFNQGLF